MGIDATPGALAAHLREQHDRLRERINAGQTAIAQEMSPLGRVRSSSAMHAGVRMLDETLSSYFDFALESAPKWIGTSLPEEIVRELFASELREVLYELTIPRAAYRPHPPEVAFLEPLREKLDERLDAFAARPLTTGNTDQAPKIEVRKASSVAEAIRSAQETEEQTSSIVQLTTGEIEAALERLSTIMADLQEGVLEIRLEPDLQTIRSQLKKEDPNVVILQEAGKSVEAILKSSVCWDQTPGLRHALGALTVSLGII